MTKLLNTYEQADFERLAAFYPYRDEHGLTLPVKLPRTLAHKSVLNHCSP